jgi:multidrug resistance efflux pump
MDIRRAPRPHTRRTLIVAGSAVAAISSVAFILSGNSARDPVVERSSLVIDSVSRGTLLRDVVAPGNLVPESVRIIAAVTAGRVEQLPVRSGVLVDPETVLVELSNPDVELQQLESDGALTQSQAQAVSDRGMTEGDQLSQRSLIATLSAQLGDARRQLAVLETLSAEGLAAKIELAAARDRVAELAARESLERQRLQVLGQTSSGKTALQREQIARLRAISRFHERRRASMRVRAGESGVLQELPLELGQWVNPGMVLARVAKPDRLKAVIRVPESQAGEVAVGQKVTIDTRNGVTTGTISRVAPVSQGGSVEAEAIITGTMPEGSRAALGVDCTIEVQRLHDVLHVARPASVQANSVVDLFRIDEGGNTASRVRVGLGAASLRSVQVISGLHAGDNVVVSELAVPEGVMRVKLR